MSDDQEQLAQDARLRLACGRIAGGARAIAEAHRLDVAEGRHDHPWGPDYHREAARVYADTLPQSYQSDIAALFGQSADAMERRLIPGKLAADWAIVAEYLRNATAAIEAYKSTADGSLPRTDSAGEPALADTPPMVIRYDALARLTTLDGATRLEQAALAVMDHMAKSVPATLDQAERHLLERVASGVPVIELAAELGYSRRSMFRELARLWRKLGVSNRTEGIRQARSQGLLD